MGQLRDFFAAVGICESSEDIARKPALVDRLVKYSTASVMPLGTLAQTCSYEERLRLVLSLASSAALDTLLAKGVAVCLDDRLSQVKSGFFHKNIHSMFYNTPDRQVLGLYDNGKHPRDTGFFSRSITEFAGRAVDDLASMLESGNVPVLAVGSIYVVGRTTNFHWRDARQFESELDANPDLMKVPSRWTPALEMSVRIP